MKYSILVLGASISIGLFIRICCALEANALYQDHSGVSGIFTDFKNPEFGDITPLITGKADDVYKKLLKYSVIQNGNHISTRGKEIVGEIVDSWVNDIVSIRSSSTTNSSQSQVPQSPKSSSASDDYYNEHLCGVKELPDLDIKCTDPSCVEEWFDSIPAGCQYEREQNYMTCTDNSVTSIPPVPPQLDMLDLNETQIQTVPMQAFRNVSIGTIRFFRNSIEFIHPWAFHDVNGLKTLLIVDNQIKYLSFEIYVGINDTMLIDLQHNLISFEVYKNCSIRPVNEILPVLPQLRMMFLGGNPLTIIPEQMFAGLRYSPLMVLYLDNAYLESIHPDAFSFLPNLTTLNLNRNPQLMPTLGSALSSANLLKCLYLSYNGLQEIPIDAISRFADTLQILELDGNYFNSIEDNVLDIFKSLQELYLNDCGILSVAPNAFQNIPKLRALELQQNRMRQAPTNLAPSLEFLYLTNSDSNLMRTNADSFQGLAKLKVLELSGVQFNTISNITFIGLSSLTHLLLVNSNIQHIAEKSFQHMPNLQVLSLERNPLKTLTSDVFFGLGKLRGLYLVNCQLSFDKTSVSVDIESPFQHLTDVDTLDLSKNKIVHISDKLFLNMSNLRNIDISNNPIESWQSRLFPNHGDILSDDDEDGSVFHISVTHGNLQMLTDAMLHDFQHMTYVDLSENKFICDNGACKLRNIINAEGVTVDAYANKKEYKCFDAEGKAHKISDLTDDLCNPRKSPEPESEIIPQLLPDPQSSGVTLLISLTASLSLITAVVIILAYKNRVHLRYFLFVVKFNVLQQAPRKAKLSTMESTCYVYDVFISYHQNDAKFIEQEFMPEIESQEENNEGHSHQIHEARNNIFTIYADNTIAAKDSSQKFKVCLHERDFEAGVPITENIVDCVDRSRKTVIFVSKKYMESQWCSYEMNLAYNRLLESRRKSFVLVLLEDIPIESRSKVLNYLMVSRTYLHWPGMNGSVEDKSNFWKRLRHFLKSTE